MKILQDNEVMFNMPIDIDGKIITITNLVLGDDEESIDVTFLEDENYKNVNEELLQERIEAFVNQFLRDASEAIIADSEQSEPSSPKLTSTEEFNL